MTRRYSDPAKLIRNAFINAETESRASLPGCPKCDGSAIREGIQRAEQLRETMPDEHWAITEAVATGQVTEDTEMDAMVAAAVRKMAARKPGSAPYADLPAKLATPAAPRPDSYRAPEGAGTATMPKMEDMSSQELQRATLDAFGSFAQLTRRI
jgi:hypothetical protein